MNYISNILESIILEIIEKYSLNILYVETIQRDPTVVKYNSLDPTFVYDIYYCMSLYGTINIEMDLKEEKINVLFKLHDISNINFIN